MTNKELESRLADQERLLRYAAEAQNYPVFRQRIAAGLPQPTEPEDDDDAVSNDQDDA